MTLMSLNGGPISWKSSRQGGVTLSSSEAEFVDASQAGQEVVYLRALLRGFGYPQRGATEIWEDNASCIMMSENPTNRDRSRHVDVKVHFVRDLVRDGHIKLVKCAVTQNVLDALTKSLPRPAFEKHREYMVGTKVPFSALYVSTVNLKMPIVAYVIKLPINGKNGAMGFFSDQKSSPAGSIPVSPKRHGSTREQIIPPEPARTCKLMRMTGSKKYSPVGTKAQPRVGLDF